MKLKGDWSSETTYSIGDVVRFTDNVFYHLQKPCKSGVPPIDTLYWGRASAIVAIAAGMAMDALDLIVIPEVPDNISDSAILLNSSTASSTKQFIITVDDSGELSADEITEETQEGGES
jgi:hypothetical protein